MTPGSCQDARVSNENQREFWNGIAGEAWVEDQRRMDVMLRPFGDALLEACGIAPTEHCLEIGCGTGDLALRVSSRLTEGSMLGVDFSRPMLAHARYRADETAASVEFVEADASTHAFAPATIDCAYSRFGVMFFHDPTSAFANVRRGLASGGRLVFLCWQDSAVNPWMHLPIDAARSVIDIEEPPPDHDAPGPFSFARRERVEAILGEAGYRDVTIDAFETPMVIAGSIDDAMAFFGKRGPMKRIFADAGEDETQRALDAVRRAIEPHHSGDSLSLPAATWLVSARG
jgi:SAM-dependent methyltransferase